MKNDRNEAEIYMAIRVRLYATMGLIRRDNDLFGAAVRSAWGMRFIRDFNDAPLLKARNSVCR